MKIMEIEFIDFSSSYLIFKIDTDHVKPESVSHAPPFSINNARINHECIATLEEKKTGKKDVFFLGASCKTERVGVESEIWTEPNADFVPIFSESHYLNIKTFEHAQIEIPLYPPELGSQPSRQYGLISNNFVSVKQIVNKTQGKILNEIETIIEWTLNGIKLNALSIIENERYLFSIQYPIKTMNVNENNNIIQTDTGPVLFPNLKKDFNEILKNIELAYIAWNRFNYAEFLVRKEKTINEDINIFHYFEQHKIEVNNSIIISNKNF